jgi:hypothetical protein
MAFERGGDEDKFWRLGSPLVILSVVVLAALLGFVVIPIVQGRSAGPDAYTAICRALVTLPPSFIQW